MYDRAHGFQTATPWWPAICRPVNVVALDEKRLGLRFTCTSGERMTMPLEPITGSMPWRK
jgi:hypothetical protein